VPAFARQGGQGRLAPQFLGPNGRKAHARVQTASSQKADRRAWARQSARVWVRVGSCISTSDLVLTGCVGVGSPRSDVLVLRNEHVHDAYIPLARHELSQILSL